MEGREAFGDRGKSSGEAEKGDVEVVPGSGLGVVDRDPVEAWDRVSGPYRGVRAVTADERR
jgi:hypothetical protein